MAAVILGLEEFEERLCRIRRRLNSLVVQHALYLSGGLILLALSLLVVLAIHAEARAFRIVFWAVVVAAVCSLPVVALTLQRRWFSLDRAARLADSTAHLDDRLATLLAQRQPTCPSRLRGVLLSQVLAMGPKWDIRVIAPRRISSSLYFLLAALLVLVATSLIERPPPAEDHAAATRPHGAPGRDSASTSGSPRKRDRNARRALFGDSGAAGQAEIRSSALGAAAAQHRGGGQSLGTSQQGQKEQELLGNGGPGQGSGGRPQAGNDAQRRFEAVAEGVQNKIRMAFRAEPLDNSPPNSQRDRQDAGADGMQQGGSSPALRADTRRPAPREHPWHRERNPQAPRGRQAPGDSKAASSQRQVPGGAKPAAGDGKAGGHLFAKGAGLGGAAATPGERLKLNLSAYSVSAPMQLEPQSRVSSDGAESSGIPGGIPTAPQLSDQQASDAPLQKVEISPEHEAILRSIFTRGK